jgi:hypothetical protein
MRTEQLKKYGRRLAQSLLAAAFIFALASFSFGQSSAGKPPPTPPSNPAPSDNPIIPEKKESDTRFGSPENEMRSKLVLKEEKKRYEENLGRAREVSELAVQLSESYESNKAFNSQDSKKLERLEKLSKRIRNEAGGSETESGADLKDICSTMTDTIKHLAELAEELHKLVDKTPRNVVSAAVIDQANRVIVVTQHLRSTR